MTSKKKKLPRNKKKDTKRGNWKDPIPETVQTPHCSLDSSALQVKEPEPAI